MDLVTGATGMLGSHLVYRLLKQGRKVRAIKREGASLDQLQKIVSFYDIKREIDLSTIEWIEADILDYNSLLPAFENIDHVYHAAAMVSFARKDHNDMLRNNIKGTANMVDLALEKQVKKFCHVSSIAALGSSTADNQIIDEASQRNHAQTHSGYSLSKFHSELEVWRGITEGLNAVIVNPSVILGPGDWSKGSASLVGTVAKGMKFYTSGATGFVDARDVAEIMIKLTESDIKGERYVVNAANASFKEVFDLMATQLGKSKPSVKATKLMLSLAWRLEWLKCQFTRKEPKLSAQTARSAFSVSTFSNDKLKNVLGFEFRPIEETIHDICSIYLGSTH